MRGPSSCPATSLFGKNPKARVDYPGGPTVVVGMTFRFCCWIVSKSGYFRSQSRMRGDFLWYEEQIEMSQEERDAKAARRCVSCGRRDSGSLIRNSQGEEGSRPYSSFSCPTTGPSGQNRGFHQTNLQHPRSTHIRVSQVAHCCIFLRT
jgi:hypothetical protein